MFESETAPRGIHRGPRHPIAARQRQDTARHINVPRDSATIQGAIDGANVGDTIHVQPQTYSEQIIIDKDLTLVGAGANSTIIQSPNVLPPDNFGKRFIVQIRKGAIVTMSGFKITGPGGSPQWGISVKDGSTMELSHATVTRIRNSPGLNGGTGIMVGIPSWLAEENVGNAVISQVLVSEYSNHGICVLGNGSTADILQNEVIGYGPTSEIGQAAIMVGDGAKATIMENKNVSQNLCDQDGFGPDPINQGQCVGILAAGANSDTVISKNRVENNDVGIYLYSSTGLDQTNDNILTNNRYFGLIIQDSDNICIGNNITGGNVGIGVVADSADTFARLRNNRITNTSIMPVQTISAGGYSARYRTT